MLGGHETVDYLWEVFLGNIRHVETSLFFKATTLFVFVIAFSFFSFIKKQASENRI